MAISEIDVDELERRAQQGVIHVIDVREPDEYEGGHVPGAVSIPLSTVPERIDEFRGGEPTFVICRSGGRSMRACEVAAEAGIDVANVAGGTLAWADSGRPLVTGW